ncbi:MAG: universal stress protein [Desulfobacter sp.]|nr:universal stress protein [Desulfobacter sp.]WDP86573.1 MAG: universal stress protein [Desulfobacter sp.]
MKILVGYKGSNVGKDLLDLATIHARAFKASVLVVTSMKEGAETDQEMISDAEKNLEQAQNFFDEKGVDCKTHLLIRGLDPGDDIVAFANEKQVDEILIGVKSRSKVGKLLFGSTAQAVILTSDCPVVSVK